MIDHGKRRVSDQVAVCLAASYTFTVVEMV